MNKLFPVLCIAAWITFGACTNEDKQKQPEAEARDTAAVSKFTSGTDTAKKADSLQTAGTPKPVMAKEFTTKSGKSVKEAAEKVDHEAAGAEVAVKKNLHRTDSSITTVKKAIPAPGHDNPPAKDLNPPSASAADNSKSFAPKFGLIPWNANENNITAFKTAFPDKQTLVRINFDADPDTYMQNVKTQIINALKKSGYQNVSEQSQIFHPTRIPKDIHFELQRDGSVVIWLPPANQ